MRSLIKLDNQKKQVHIEDSKDEEGLVRSMFLKQKVDDIFTFKLQESKETRANKKRYELYFLSKI